MQLVCVIGAILSIEPNCLEHVQCHAFTGQLIQKSIQCAYHVGTYSLTTKGSYRSNQVTQHPGIDSSPDNFSVSYQLCFFVILLSN
mmetsp:Transcript_35198/g.42467  ORF Transcript_35198/g.42467 Transcript_35198/m.42467 type:complete len:86 (+) Transcript_35198:91-348(+)